jgi:hypothetical protein
MYKSRPMVKGRYFPDLLTIIIAALVIVEGFIFFPMVVHKTPASTSNIPVEAAPVTKEIIPGEDMVLSLGDLTLYLPKGATSQPGYISMIPGEPNLHASASDAGWIRPTVVNIEYRNHQGRPVAGISFYKPASICFQFEKELWQDYTRRPDAYQVEYYAESLFLSRWLPLQTTANPESHQLCGQTYHLSLYALAIMPEAGVPLPIIPNTGPTLAPTTFPTEPNPTDPVPTRPRGQGSFLGIFPIFIPTAIPPTIIPTAIPPTVPPTAIPPTAVPTAIPPTTVPTEIIPTEPPPTEPPTEIIPTEPPATEPPTEIVPTEPPPTEIVPTDPPPTDPPATDPPPTEPPATDPPATDPPATDPPATDPPPEGSGFCLVFT